MTATVEIFGLTILNQSIDEAALDLVRCAAEGVRTRVYFVNAHSINVAADDGDLFQSLSRAQRLYADGIGMRIACRLAGRTLIDNVNGTDLFPRLCRIAARERVPIGLLGARRGVAERCAARLQTQFPGLAIPFVHHGYIEAEDAGRVMAQINASGARMLFVGMGVPRQELWIDSRSRELDVPVQLGVGALFDFYSGDVRRAPGVIRRFGMEWAWRLALEPSRLFARYVVGNPVFMARAMRRRVAGAAALRERTPRGS